MKIGVFHPNINVCGGAEYAAINIINLLKSRGHSITILLNEKVKHERIKTILNKSVYLDREVVIPFDFKFFGTYFDIMRSLILKKYCEVLIDTYSGFVLPWSNIVYIQGPLRDVRPNPYYYPRRLLALKAKTKEHEKIVFANSYFTAGHLKNRFGIDAEILYPPVDVDFFRSKHNAQVDRTDAVVTLSRISKEKNLMGILRIASLVGENIKFILVGILRDRQVLKSFFKSAKDLGIESKIEILTDATRKEVRQVLSRSKVYLHTAINEAFGISIIEAMASGCIPVVHDSGGPKEFVPRSLRYSNVQQAAEIIEKAIHEWSPQYADRFVKLSQKYGEEKFSKEFIKLIKMKRNDFSQHL